MIKDIAVHCEHGQIKIIWKWGDEDVEKVGITYKKKESSHGDGIPFTAGGIVKFPHMEMGSVTKPLCGEQGLYTFTFLPCRKDGSFGERVIVDDVILGNRIDIIWNIYGTKAGAVIGFQVSEGCLPAGLLTVERGMVKCEIWEEINSYTRLLFPGGILQDKPVFCIKKPFDKVYHLYQK